MKKTVIGAVALAVWVSGAFVIAQDTQDAPPPDQQEAPIAAPQPNARPTVPQPPAPRPADVPPPAAPAPGQSPSMIPPPPPPDDVPQAAPGSSGPGPATEAGYLGVIGDDRHDRGRGIRVIEVRPGGPAHLAGLLPGDLIVGVSGVRVRQMSDMVDIIRQSRPGTTLALDVHRNNERRNVHVTLAHRPMVQPVPDATGGSPTDPHGTRMPTGPPDPFGLDSPQPPQEPVADGPRPDGPPLPPKSTEDSARLELLEQRLDLLEMRMQKMERAMVDLAKALKSR